MLSAIAFDADDTLWHTEPNYRQTEERLLALLSGYGVSAQEMLDRFHRIEIRNLEYFGYGIRGFTLSMIEAAIQVTGGRVRGAEIQEIIEMGKVMTAYPITLLDGVEEALRSLAGRRLLLITKGDLLDQESKLQRSGLGPYFTHVEIVSDKTPEVYAAVLRKHAIDPAHFVMIGDSLRSDMAPALALGGYAVHVPYPDGWAHESAADLPPDRSRFFEIASLSDLPALLEQIERA